jgi:biotin carboxylase
MAEVAARLGLACYLSPESARIATDKLLMKRAFERFDVPSARHLEIGPGERPSTGGLRYPVVVKPCDAQGQRGVRKVADAGALAEAVAAAFDSSRSKKVLVEEFADGHEVTVNAWLEDGNVKVLAITDRVTYNPFPALGICFQHVFPSKWAAGLAEKLRDASARLARAYGVSQGPLYIQAIVSGTDVFVVEGSCRVGGGHENRLIPLVTGVDVTDRLIDLALGLETAPIDRDFAAASVEKHALVNFLLPRAGRIARASGFSALREEGLVVEGEFYRAPGDVCDTVTDGNGRVGYFIAVADSRERLLARAEKAYAQITLEDDRGQPMLFRPEGDELGS